MRISETSKKNAETIGNMANSFSFNVSEICKYIAMYEHRTIQQTITRFCIEWLRTCASEDYGYDLRNEQSHKVAKELLDGHDIYLPMI